jgi:shikimate 5-dehydrogenase
VFANEEGELIGTNTDAGGFLEAIDIDLTGKPVAVVGQGVRRARSCSRWRRARSGR